MNVAEMFVALGGILLTGFLFHQVASVIRKALERRGAVQPKEMAAIAARLEHMDQAIDAMAVEIERISEGQRFTTKLLSERPGEPALPPRS